MSIRLLVRQRGEAGGADKPTEVLLQEEDITLGRDKACQVVLAQQAVSRSHARISRDGTLFFIEDLGSAYGTQVNGQPLPKGEKRLLRQGDVIAIAQFDLTFDRVADLPQGAEGDRTAYVARQVVKDVMRGLGSREGPYFRIMNGPREGERIELSDAQELIVGRDETAQVVIKDELVSRHHAKLRRDWSGTHVEDLGSRNGIRVNRKRVARKTLHDRDEVEIGNIRLLYLDPAEVREAPVLLEEDDEEDKTVPPAPEPEPEQDDPAPDEAVEAAPAGEDDGEEPASPEEGEKPPDEKPAEDKPEGDSPDDDKPDGAAEEDQPPEGDEEEEPPEPGLRGKVARLRGMTGSQIIPLVAMGVFAVVAIGVLIALLVGA